MRIPELVIENSVVRFTREQIKKHPYLSATVGAGLVFGGTLYDIITHVGPIQQQARQEAYAICNYPTQKELEFVDSLPRSVSPVDRQRANQIEARVKGCAATATYMENTALRDNGRPLFVLELFANGMAGTTLLGAGVLRFLNRRRSTT